MCWLICILVLYHVSTFYAYSIKLTDQNFDQQVDMRYSRKGWLVKFSQNWDTRYENEWYQIAGYFERTANATLTVVVAEVDENRNMKLSQRFGITEQPTVLYMTQGMIYVLENRLTLENVIDFVSGGKYLVSWSHKFPTYLLLIKIWFYSEHGMILSRRESGLTLFTELQPTIQFSQPYTLSLWGEFQDGLFISLLHSFWIVCINHLAANHHERKKQKQSIFKENECLINNQILL